MISLGWKAAYSLPVVGWFLGQSATDLAVMAAGGRRHFDNVRISEDDLGQLFGPGLTECTRNLKEINEIRFYQLISLVTTVALVAVHLYFGGSLKTPEGVLKWALKERAYHLIPAIQKASEICFYCLFGAASLWTAADYLANRSQIQLLRAQA